MTAYVPGYALGVVPLGVLLLKGRGWACVAAFCALIVPIAGPAVAEALSLRLAKPHSWWAARRYGTAKMREARERYPEAPNRPAVELTTAGWLLLLVVAPGLIVVELTSGWT